MDICICSESRTHTIFFLKKILCIFPQAVLTLAEKPKLADGDFNDLMRVLRKVVAKDSNVVNVTLAANIIAALANGLRKAFASQAAQVCVCVCVHCVFARVCMCIVYVCVCV